MSTKLQQNRQSFELAELAHIEQEANSWLDSARAKKSQSKQRKRFLKTVARDWGVSDDNDFEDLVLDVRKLAIQKRLAFKRQSQSNRFTESDAPQHVTRDQIASLIEKHKDTVAAWFNDDPEAPIPCIEGGGGKAHEYTWDTVRPWLQQKTGRRLPKKFPERIF